tara:strand:- start:2079 stop:3212 length:1134 start_codon:yes stop_codon:yes gene_type:complete
MLASIYTIDDSVELTQRSQEWLTLADKVNGIPPFCRPEAWIPALHALLNDLPAVGSRKLCQAVIVEVREGEELLAVYALYRKGNHLCSLTENHIDYQDIITVDLAAAGLALKTSVNYAAESGLVFIIGHVSDQSILAQIIEAQTPFSNAWLNRRFFSVCIVSDHEFASGTSDEFFKSIPKRLKKSYRSGTNRMKSQDPPFEVDYLWGADIQPADIEAIGQLHRENQQSRTGSSPFDEPEFVQFLQQLANSLPSLFLSRYTCDGKLIAFCLGYASDNTFYFYITDYDRSYAYVSPGVNLLIKTAIYLVDHFQGKHFRIDFLLGSEAYKSHWETGRYYVDRVVVIPKSIRTLPWAIGYHLGYRLKEIKNRIRKIGPGSS